MTQGWSWETGTPKERADIVRSHLRLSDEHLMELFDLTPHGLRAITDGDIWRLEYSRSKNQ